MNKVKVLFYYIDSQSSSGYSTGLGIASISGYLKRYGVQTALVYFKTQADFQYAINKTRDFSPNIIGFYSTATGWPVVNMLSEELRRLFPGVFQIYGGIHATLNPDISQSTQSLDALCVGYGEMPMLQLCRHIAQGLPFDGIPGLSVRKHHGRSIITETEPYFPQSDHDQFMYFDHNLFLEELSRYNDFNRKSYML